MRFWCVFPSAIVPHEELTTLFQVPSGWNIKPPAAHPTLHRVARITMRHDSQAPHQAPAIVDHFRPP